MEVHQEWNFPKVVEEELFIMMDPVCLQSVERYMEEDLGQ
jgi:DNA replication protein DnaD